MRPERPKFNVVKPPAGLNFMDKTQQTHGIYYQKLTEAVNADCVIQIASSDSYLKNQLKTQAKKMGLRLVFAEKDGMLYIKPIANTEEENRLLLWLREKRTIEELQSKSLQMDLPDTLKRFRALGLVEMTKNVAGMSHWRLTEEGVDFVKRSTK